MIFAGVVDRLKKDVGKKRLLRKMLSKSLKLNSLRFLPQSLLSFSRAMGMK